MEEYMLPCMSKKLFGIDCPGCGMQRSLSMVARGEFLDAFSMFPAIYTTILLFFFLLLHFIDRSHKYNKIIVTLAITNAVIMIIAYIYKMSHL